MLQYSVYCTITFTEQQDIVIVGDDTDLLCLCALSDIGFKRIFFHTELKLNIKVRRSYWDRLQVQQAFGKTSISIQGLKGPADEDEDETRAACVALAGLSPGGQCIGH